MVYVCGAKTYFVVVWLASLRENIFLLLVLMLEMVEVYSDRFGSLEFCEDCVFFIYSPFFHSLSCPHGEMAWSIIRSTCTFPRTFSSLFSPIEWMQLKSFHSPFSSNFDEMYIELWWINSLETDTTTNTTMILMLYMLESRDEINYEYGNYVYNSWYNIIQ